MLMPDERVRAVDILVNHQVSSTGGSYMSDGPLRELLRNGFRGYSRFTDGELVRALQRISKNNHQAQEFIGNLLIDKLVLGD